jgi:hypothetical protein
VGRTWASHQEKVAWGRIQVGQESCEEIRPLPPVKEGA